MDAYGKSVLRIIILFLGVRRNVWRIEIKCAYRKAPLTQALTPLNKDFGPNRQEWGTMPIMAELVNPRRGCPQNQLRISTLKCLCPIETKSSHNIQYNNHLSFLEAFEFELVLPKCRVEL